MAALADFEGQVTILNNSFIALQGLVTSLNTSIATLNTELSSTLSSADATKLLADLTAAVAQFETLLPVTPAPQS